jgi:hypothetical protein
VCVWNVLSVCVMRLVCRPGVSMKILTDLIGGLGLLGWCCVVCVLVFVFIHRCVV